MRTMRTNKILAALFIAPFALISCNMVDNNRNSETATIRVFLTDAPGDYQEVNVDVLAVQVIINDSIIDLKTNQGVYNLLDFVNGEDTLLVSDEVPSGMLSQVRLVLGETNSVTVDDMIYGMKTPSAQESGLKFNVHQDILPGTSYTYVVDFDAARSVVETGNKHYVLKPLIRVYTEAVTGSIEGTVQPPEAGPTVMAIGRNEDTTTIFTDTVSGKFMIRGLAAGYYDLQFHPDTGFADTTLWDLEVTAGEITLLDTLWLQVE